MPILAREVDLHPANLLDEVSEQPWWAVYTLARREKSLLRYLLGKGVDFYCPMLVSRQRQGRTSAKSAYLPMFAGYVFVRGSEPERLVCLQSNLISQCIRVPEPGKLVTDLQRLRCLLESGQPVSSVDQLVAGQRVRIKNGLLSGLEGSFMREGARQQFVVLVDFLQRGAAVEIDPADIELV